MASEQQILVFNVKGEELGLDISYIKEILMPQEIHPLPNAPEFVEGVINLRGKIVVIFDLRKKLGVQPKEEAPVNRIIICRIENILIGLIVDGVSEVLSVSWGSIEHTSEADSLNFTGGYVSDIARIGDRVIVVLDLGKIISKEVTKKLAHTPISKTRPV